MADKTPCIEIDIAGDTPEETKREKREKEEPCGGLFSGRCCGKHSGGKRQASEALETVEYGTAAEAGDNDRLYRVVAQMYSQMLTLKGRTSYPGAKGPQKKH